MTVIDLAEIRNARAFAREYVVELGRQLGQLACDQAERAHAVSGPLMASDPVLARGVNQVVRRHLLRAARKMLPEGLRKKVVDSVIQQVENVYRGRLLALMDGGVGSSMDVASVGDVSRPSARS